jgi:hypothetical protein
MAKCITPDRIKQLKLELLSVDAKLAKGNGYLANAEQYEQYLQDVMNRLVKKVKGYTERGDFSEGAIEKVKYYKAKGRIALVKHRDTLDKINKLKSALSKLASKRRLLLDELGENNLDKGVKSRKRKKVSVMVEAMVEVQKPPYDPAFIYSKPHCRICGRYVSNSEINYGYSSCCHAPICQGKQEDIEKYGDDFNWVFGCCRGAAVQKFIMKGKQLPKNGLSILPSTICA